MVVPPYLMPVYPMIAGLSVAPRAAGSLFFRGIVDQSVQSGGIKPGDTNLRIVPASFSWNTQNSLGIRVDRNYFQA
jgi:hypothetical protein